MGLYFIFMILSPWEMNNLVFPFFWWGNKYVSPKMASTLFQKLIFLIITYGFISVLFGIQKTLLQCNVIYKMSYGALHNSFAFLESSKRKRDGGKELKN